MNPDYYGDDEVEEKPLQFMSSTGDPGPDSEWIRVQHRYIEPSRFFVTKKAATTAAFGRIRLLCELLGHRFCANGWITGAERYMPESPTDTRWVAFRPDLRQHDWSVLVFPKKLVYEAKWEPKGCLQSVTVKGKRSLRFEMRDEPGNDPIHLAKKLVLHVQALRDWKQYL